MRTPRRLGVLVSHPIQYLSPWFRYLATRLDLEVLYAHRQDARGQGAAGFGVEFDWDVPLLEGYRHRWLRNVARRPSVQTFSGCDTPELYDLVRPERYDALLVIGWNRKSSLQAIRACWRSGVPVLMRGDSQLTTARSSVKRAIKLAPYRWFLPRIDAHLFVGARNRAYLRHYGVPEERLFFAPHFVDNAFFAERARAAREAGEPRSIRAELGIPAEAFVFAYVGKMVADKRPGDFVRACLLAGRDGDDIHGLVVGDGPLRAEMESSVRAAAGKVHFAGFRNQTEMAAFYAAADALVLPGDETWGLVVNEAAACGVPAVVTEAAGCAPDLIDEGETGFTYPHGDVAALAERMSKLRSVCRSRSAAVAETLRRKAEVYSIERATAGLLDALNAVAARRRPRRSGWWMTVRPC